MDLESALFFESLEQIYARIFRTIKPRTAIPEVRISFRKYANANSRIQLEDGSLTVYLSDLLEGAPAPVQEALASILICKLFRRAPDEDHFARYRRYLNRPDVRRTLHLIKQERGRKLILEPRGRVYDLCEVFEELNFEYFHGLMSRPRLGWSIRPSRTTLGHYDPSHNTIVLTNLLDSSDAPKLIVSYIMYHEMLHLRFPTHHRGAKRCVHTPQFKAAERSFGDLKKAQAELKRFLNRSQTGA